MLNRSFLNLFISFTIWSSWLIPVRLLGENAITVSFFTTLFAAFFWGIFYLLKKRKKTFERKKIIGLIILSIFFVLNMATYLGALKFTNAAIAVLTHYTAPVFVAFIAPFVLKEKITKDKVFSLILSLIGFFIIFFKKTDISNDSLSGTFLGLASGLFYALIIVTAKKLLQDVEEFAVLFFQNLFGTFWLILFYKGINFNGSFQLYSTLFLLSFMYSVVASYFYITSLSKVEGTRVAIIGYLEPVGTIFWGWLFFKESITIRTILGAVLILYSGYRVASNFER